MKKYIFILLILISNFSFSQYPGCPNVDAGPDQTTTCANPCVDLTATLLQTGETSTYTVSSIPYAPPFPFSGGTGVSVNTDDVYGGIIDLPFDFCFYGQSYNQVVVGSNGVISFNTAYANGSCPWSFTASVPSSSLPSNSIFGAYLDIDPSVCGNIYYDITGSYPCRTFVFKFNQVCYFDCNSLMTSQEIVLYEGTNAIEVYIQHHPVCSGWNSGNAVIGIQNTGGTSGITPPGRNTGSWTANNEAWRFTPSGTPNYTVNWYEAGNLIGTGLTINVCPTAPAGSSTTYTAEAIYNNCNGSTITVTDDVDVLNNSTMSVSTSFTDPTCAGSTNGTASVSGTSNSPPVNYLWSNSSNSTTITNLGAGTYDVTVSDNGGCTITSSVTLTDPPQIVVDSSSTTPDTCGANDGTINISASGGTGTLSYNYGSGANTTGIFQNLSAGNYIVTITDDNSCSITQSLTVGVAGAVTADFTQSNNQCLTGNSFDFTNTGDTGPGLTWLWNFQGANTPSSNLENPTGVSWNTSGTYTVTQLLARGNCTDTASYTVTIYQMPDVSATSVNVTCFGGSDGSVTANTNSGTSPYSYVWNDPNNSNTQTASNLAVGTYAVTVTDANGCKDSTNINVNEPANPLQVTVLDSIDVLCFGQSSGSINLNVSGGTFPYYYNWSNSATTQDNLNIPAGTYTVTITDANNCTTNRTVIINQPTALTSINTSTDVSCNGSSDGVASILPSGGTPPYYYHWTNNNTNQSNTNLYPGSYSVTVTDANGCSIDTLINIEEPDEVISAISPRDTICIGQTTTVYASGTGGTPPYSYNWNNGQTSSSFTVHPDSTTHYTVQTTDANGCVSGNSTTTVYINPPLEIEIEVSDKSVCKGDPIEITSYPNGGNGHYIYTLQNGNTISNPYTYYTSGTTKETITVTLTDDCGTPSAFDTATITILPLPEFTFQPNITNGCEPLDVHFNSISSDPNLSYLWNFGDSNDNNNLSNKQNPSHTYNENGVFDVQLIAENDSGCRNSLTVQHLITVYKNPNAKFIADPEVIYNIKPILNFFNYSSDATSYTWYFGDNDSSDVTNPSHTFDLTQNKYNVMLIAETIFGCKDTASQEIIVQEALTFYAPTAFTPDDDGINDIWKISGTGIDNKNFELYIFDRWGEIIFSTNDLNKGWNGKVKNHKYAETGSYTWVAHFKDLYGNDYERLGSFILYK